MCSKCDNLNDDLSDIFGGSSDDYLVDGKADTTLSNAQQYKMHEEKCKACSGSGQFRSYTGRVVGQCFKCKGKGVRYFRQSLEQREKAKARREEKKAEKQRETAAEAASWAEANEAEYQWLRANAGYNNFARSLLEALNKFGSLTEKQAAAVTKILEQNRQREIKAQQRIENASTVNVGPLYDAFETALSNGLKRPKMFLGEFKFSLAPNSGRNAGCIYVVRVEDDKYLGKITAEKKFLPVRSTTEEEEQQVIDICASPLENAIAYGKQTGVCSCCGRELTNEESIERGIGPICAGRYGW